jgi:hypothetical protein
MDTKSYFTTETGCTYICLDVRGTGSHKIELGHNKRKFLIEFGLVDYGHTLCVILKKIIEFLPPSWLILKIYAIQC